MPIKQPPFIDGHGLHRRLEKHGAPHPPRGSSCRQSNFDSDNCKSPQREPKLVNARYFNVQFPLEKWDMMLRNFSGSCPRWWGLYTYDGNILAIRWMVAKSDQPPKGWFFNPSKILGCLPPINCPRIW